MSAVKRVAFFDVGGVVLSNGWDHVERARAVERFGLEREEFEARHARLAAGLERGEITLDQYLAETVFDRPRTFTAAEFRAFMFSLSEARPESMAVVGELARAGRARLATLNNEGREFNAYRIEKFRLRSLFSVFCSSCYLGARKPEAEIFGRALGVMQAEPGASLFIDDREENLTAPRELGMDVVRFESAAQLRGELAQRGLL